MTHMKAIAELPEEQERLHELNRYGLLDSFPEKEYDDIVQLASLTCQAPVAILSFIDSSREWFKAQTGISISEVPTEAFPGSVVVEQQKLLQLNDPQYTALLDQSISKAEGPFRFYAGIPVITTEGYAVGVLSVLDTQPRELSSNQVFALEALAGQVARLLELRVKNSDAQRAMSTQNRITSIIAHDVRNPLAALKAIIELKTSGMLTEEETTEMLSMSAQQLDGTLEMVANVVDCGKLQAKAKLSEKQQVAIQEQVSLAFNTQQPKAGVKNNQLVNNVAPDLMASIDTDTQVIQFLLRNLLDNAIKFTENGTITVNARNLHNRLEIKVTDTGNGIPAAKLANLFDTQKNSNTTGTRGEKGSGLGLILVKTLLERLKGRIQIDSQEQSGTTVTVIL